MTTGILFDLDGTLLNTLEDLVDATNYALAAFGHPPRTLKEVRRFIGNGAENQIRLSLPDDHKEDLQQVLAVYKPYYTDHCQIKTKPYDGVLAALEILKEKYPIAIVSNKPDAAVKKTHVRRRPLPSQEDQIRNLKKLVRRLVLVILIMLLLLGATGYFAAIHLMESDVVILPGQNYSAVTDVPADG